MKAVVWTRYGPPDVLQLQDVPKPAPKDNEILIRVRATTVTAGDCELRSFKTLGALWLPLRIYVGLFRPTRIKILGQELAGEIEAAGRDVTKFKAGDPVLAWAGLRLGGYAEYACLPQTALMAIKPADLSFAEAAAIPVGGMEAWHYLKGNVRPGQRVLVVGAGGTIGTFGVQIAKHLGADVTALDSAGKFEMLRSIGADHVIDYTREDFAKSGQTYDLIFDAPGKTTYAHAKRALKPDGEFLSANPGLADQVRSMRNLAKRRGQVTPEFTPRGHEELLSLLELFKAGKIRTVIDRTYPLEQAAEAHRYAETGEKKGNLVLIVD
jgi:NADPH:quinone reductase-like Zn-dependent oxidoreductase